MGQIYDTPGEVGSGSKNHIGAVADIAALTALTEDSLNNDDEVTVRSELNDYYYNSTAVAGDEVPDDQTGGTGFWLAQVSGGGGSVVFGTTAGTATEGNDARVPTTDENDALAGTNGSPSASNEYVTNSDPRLLTYTKRVVEVTTTSNNFNSSSLTNIPGLTDTIATAGDYLMTVSINGKPESDNPMSISFAINGTPNTNQARDFNSKKNKLNSIDKIFNLGPLSASDVVTVQVDTDSENYDLTERYMILEAWL